MKMSAEFFKYTFFNRKIQNGAQMNDESFS